jgi:hypothetical protein
VKKKYSFDIDLFRVIRSYKDGITFFEFIINLDLYESDHKPAFNVLLIIFNLKIIELEIYNIYHKKKEG